MPFMSIKFIRTLSIFLKDLPGVSPIFSPTSDVMFIKKLSNIFVRKIFHLPFSARRSFVAISTLLVNNGLIDCFPELFVTKISLILKFSKYSLLVFLSEFIQNFLRFFVVFPDYLCFFYLAMNVFLKFLFIKDYY